MSRWFRHYAGMMRDEKLVGAAVRAKQPVERVLWVWGALLESAAEINDGGIFEFDCGEAAYFLHCDEGDLVNILSALESMGRIVDGVIVRWSDRQFESDNSSERVRKHRKKNVDNDLERRTSDDNDDGNATEVTRNIDETFRNAPVTPPETETETETERSKKEGEALSRLAPETIEAMEAWNSLASEANLASITKFSATRRKKLVARLADCGGMPGWMAALAKIRGSPFCLGDNPRKWKADFDFLLQEQSFIRLMEGRYDGMGTNGRLAKGGSIASAFEQIDDALGFRMLGEHHSVAETG